jgi:hypothetical protein
MRRYQRNKIVYTTQGVCPNSFVIDYDPGRELFLTTKDRHPLSAAIILQMINGWAKLNKAYANACGQITIHVNGIRCEISQGAANQLARVYHEHASQFPYCQSVLPGI